MTDLEPGADFRRREYRREVFLRFYLWHTRYGSHPGCVYYLFPYLREVEGWDDEAALWFAFINGNTQNPVTSFILHDAYPYPDSRIIRVWAEHYDRLAWDTDRRYHKKSFDDAVWSYLALIGEDSQAAYWRKQGPGWDGLWKAATSIATFGRLSAWSYLEYLHIMGVEVEADTLLLRDRAGSRSHRNGLCIVTGHDEYDDHKSNPAFPGDYPEDLLRELEAEGESLLTEARSRAAGQPWLRDVTYLTLESALCTYKSWHRPNRRYPNVYNDMLYDRLQAAQAAWPEEDLSVLWDAREFSLPDQLRLEANPYDPGVHPAKQNHYRETGEVVMMDLDYPAFRNSFTTAVRGQAFGRFR